jgi:thiamine-monophosphate kinase
MEWAFIAALRQRLPSHPLLRLGAGDDAAILSLAASGECVVTVDMLMDGVDFELHAVDPLRVGHKSLAVNLSDLAAMASRPVAAVVALALPRRGGVEIGLRLYDGLIALAERYQVAIAGGDTNTWDGPLVLSITALGEVTSSGPLRRGGARPGDQILVTGAFGGSILGHHLDFLPRVDEALLLNERYQLHAGTDVSDGLSIDLSHIVEESGCGAVIRTEAVPVSAAAYRLAEQQSDGVLPLDHALADGEDFELILAVPPNEAKRMLTDQPLKVPLTAIGEFVTEPGLWTVDGAGNRRAMTPKGFQHEMD